MMNRLHLSALVLVAALISTSLEAKPRFSPVYFDNPADAAIDRATLPADMRAFFEYYDEATAKINKGADATAFFTIEQATTTDSVAPLLGNIEWGQSYPYNSKCPVINGSRAVTGCVATAMAQVMYYYKYPAHGTGTCTYTGGKSGATQLVLDNITFDWNNMRPQYGSSCTTAQENAIGNLMLACGAALNMNYDAGGSGSDTRKVQQLMKNNFYYDGGIYLLDAADQQPDFEEWGIGLRYQFDLGHPVIFSGFPAVGKSGHCFVIDGYKVIGDDYYYHVNWGWSGSMNGWYLLTNLKPEKENYSGYGCIMVLGIFPPGWTGVEDVEATASTSIDPALPIFNILGQEVRADKLQRGMIYIQQGRKVIY